MNRSANESGVGIFSFYFIFLCSTRVLDLVDFFRRLIMARVVSVSSLYSEDCFGRGVILFNSRCFFLCLFLNFVCVGLHSHTCTYTQLFFSILSLRLSAEYS